MNALVHKISMIHYSQHSSIGLQSHLRLDVSHMNVQGGAVLWRVHNAEENTSEHRFTCAQTDQCCSTAHY